MLQFALVRQNTLETLQIVDQNVQLILSVQFKKHVTSISAKTLVKEHAESMLNVKSSITTLFVAAPTNIQGILLLDANPLHRKQMIQ